MRLPNLGQLRTGTPGAVPVGFADKQGRAFVFVIADGYPEKGIHEPVVLVLRHKGQHGAYGIPGGLQDASDHGKLLTTALRELAEEWLNIPKEVKDPKTHKKVDNQQAQKFAVQTLLQQSYDGVRGSTINLHPTRPPMGAYVMRVHSALDFEKMSAMFNDNIKHGASRKDKLKVAYLSSEINGHAWITQSAIREAILNQHLDNYGRLLVTTTHDPSVQLPIRDYVFGHYGSKGRWEPNRFTRLNFL